MQTCDKKSVWGVKLRPSVSNYGKKILSSIALISHVLSFIIIFVFSTRERQRFAWQKKRYIIFSARPVGLLSEVSFFFRTCAGFICEGEMCVGNAIVNI